MVNNFIVFLLLARQRESKLSLYSCFVRRLKIGIFLSCIETGAGFIGKDVVAHDEGARVGLLEFDEEGTQSGFLFGGTSVLGFLAVGSHSSDVADANGVFVVVQTVGTDLFLWASFVDAAVAVDDVVIADSFPTSGFVPAVDVLDGVVLAFGCG